MIASPGEVRQPNRPTAGGCAGGVSARRMRSERIAVEFAGMHAEILTIGDELCRGEIVDTNSSYLAARLWDLDVTTRWMTSCNDLAPDIEEALTLATGRADIVLCSGGLGPTEDDLTVDVVAKLAGVEAVIDPAARAHLEQLFSG